MSCGVEFVACAVECDAFNRHAHGGPVALGRRNHAGFDPLVHNPVHLFDQLERAFGQRDALLGNDNIDEALCCRGQHVEALLFVIPRSKSPLSAGDLHTLVPLASQFDDLTQPHGFAQETIVTGRTKVLSADADPWVGRQSGLNRFRFGRAHAPRVRLQLRAMQQRQRQRVTQRQFANGIARG